MLLSWKFLIFSPLLQYVSCLCCAWKIPHSKNWQETGSHWWACENNKAVHFPKQVSLSPPKTPETQGKCLSIFICLFLTSIAYYSQTAKKDIYLNSGLTSTKNYGKTILTKVGEYPPLQSVNVPMYVHACCVPWDCDKLPCSLRNELLAFQLSQILEDKDIGHKTKIIVFVLADKESQDWMELEDWMHCGAGMRKHS